MVLLLGLAACSGDSSSGDLDFEGLTEGQRVYDQTGDSLTGAEAEQLQQRLETLESETGADVIAYVRELDADPEATFEQVEALQQTWVETTRSDQDTAVAILINREPGDPEEARAGIFAGTTYDDGNVPRDEQEDIVADELIPALGEGDVAASLTAGVDRLSSSIRNGPPRNALNDLADGPGSTWLPWMTLAPVLLGFAAVARIHSRRARPTVAEQPPTTARPDRETAPPLAGALVAGGAQPSAVPAVVLDLAARDAIVIEQEKEPGTMSKGTVRVRLLDRGLVRGEVEQAVWGSLEEHAEGDVVDGAGLGKISHGSRDVKEVLEGQLRDRGWLAEGAGRRRGLLLVISLVAFLVTVAAVLVSSGGAPLMLVAAIPAGLLFLLGLFASVGHSRLSVAGRDAARPWEAYRDGLKQAGKDEDAPLDLDAVLPDAIALGLGGSLKKRLEAATGDDATAPRLRAFTPPEGHYAGANPAVFPWAAFTGVFGASSGTGAAGGGVSGGGAGGGGGAAGST